MDIASKLSPRSSSCLLWLLLLLPLGLEIHGFRSAHLLHEAVWSPSGQLRFLHYAELCAVVTLLFGLFARRYLLPAIAVAVVLCSACAVGIVPVATVLLFVFSSTVLGRLLFGAEIEAMLAFLAGAAFWIFAMQLTLRLPVHYGSAHLAALALPVAIGHVTSRKLAAQWIGSLRTAMSPGLAEFAASAGLAFVLLASWLIVLMPEVSTDGLAMHLAIPANIAQHHAFTIDFHRFIWALMPIGADLAYSVVYAPGGEYAARLLNFAMLAGTVCLLVQAARSFVSRPVAIFIGMLFASTPMVYLTTGSLFVENFVAIMVLGALVALWRFHNTGATRYLMLTSVLFGTSMSLKLGAVPAGLTGLALLLFAIRRARPQPSPALATAAVAVLLTLGSVPYANAWWQSGNPFFPFETGPFKSFIGDNIRDTRYDHRISPGTPYDLTFHTSDYFEGGDGSFGFQYLLFLPLIAGTFIAVRSFKARSAILVAGTTALAVAATQPNARYFYFISPLASLAGAAVLAWLHDRQIHVFRATVAAALAACFCNIWFLPAADPWHRDFYSSPLFSAAGRDAYLHGVAPQREVVSYINRFHSREGVVLADGSEIATVIAPVYSNSWTDYSFFRQVRALLKPVDVYRMFERSGISQLIVNRDDGDRGNGLNGLISTCGLPEFQAGSVAAMKLRDDCERALLTEFPTTYGKCSSNEPLKPGTYDDTDPRITWKGPWKKARFAFARSKTLSYSNVEDGMACLTIEGSGLKYFYTKAFNRGIAEIDVDGKKRALVDLYSKTTQWQRHTDIAGLGPGRHEVSLRVSATKSAAAFDYYVDLDSIEVF